MILLYTAIGLLLLFLMVLVTRAIWVKARARALGSYIDHESPEKQEYYADRLARMIQCQTVSRGAPLPRRNLRSFTVSWRSCSL